MDELKSIAIDFAEEIVAQLEVQLEKAKAHLEALKGTTAAESTDGPPGSTNPPPPKP